MNITIIYGQKHKGNTWAFVKLFLEQFEDAYVAEFYLPDESLGYCAGCVKCIMRDEKTCPHAKYMQTITTSLDNADLLIIASPCYAMGMTGQLKTLFDHLAYRYMAHRPEPSMFSKQALAISTAAGAGMGKTAKTIADNLFWWGVARIYQYGLRIYAPDFESIPDKRKKKIVRKVKRIARNIQINNKRVKVGLKTKLMFWIMRLNMKENNELNSADRKYWQKHGWLGKARPYKP